MSNKKIDNFLGEIVLYQTSQDKPVLKININQQSVWLSQEQMAELFGKAKSTINEHIKNIYEEDELKEQDTLRKFGISEFSTKPTNFYHLDMVIAVGYRVKSNQGTRFRQWATQRLSEYLTKGFLIDDELLKGTGGGNYWKELLDKIRDIRSSEKVLYRQVLDLYATSCDYDPKSSTTIEFFKIVQNKLHYATNEQTAAELIYNRADSTKDFMGLTTFKGEMPTLSEVKIAKNYLDEDELFRLNRLVSAFFDLAEIKAQEQIKMYMQNWIEELDKFASIYGKGVLKSAGTISKKQAEQKATKEFRDYEVKTLSPVEKEYLENIKEIQKTVTKSSENE